MLQMICNMALHKNAVSDKDNNFFDTIYKSDLSKSVFNQLNKYLLSKKIEFDDCFVEEKKDDDDKSILCANFMINNLLNILNKKDIHSDSKNFNNIKYDKIQKKKIDKDQNDSSDTIYDFKNIKNAQKNKIKEIFTILKKEKLSSKLIKNKHQLSQINQLNNINIKNNLHFKQVSISNVNKINVKIIEDEKKIIFPLDFKKNKHILFLSKNINRNDIIINRQNLLKFCNKKEYVKSNMEPLILNNTKNSIEWKKLITHKILLSISNKNNQVEIHLKPESLGSIHVLINMKNNAAKLKFISKCNNVRTFLDRYMPFLRNSLTKNGIKLEEFNIYDSLKNKNFKIYKNLFYKHVCNLKNFKKELDSYEKNLDVTKYKPIDVYV